MKLCESNAVYRLKCISVKVREETVLLIHYPANPRMPPICHSRGRHRRPRHPTSIRMTLWPESPEKCS
jgi:hypothetical protein